MNRLEWVLGILLVILLGVVVVLSLLFWFRPDEDTNNSAESGNLSTRIAQQAGEIAPTSVYEGQSAKIAYVAAHRAAVAWQPDAQLLNASTTWPQGTRVNTLLTGESIWEFVFYSPETATSASFSVIEDNVQLIGSSHVERPYTPLDINGWEINSGEAIQQLLEGGGFELIRDEGITVLTMALLADNQYQTGQLEWIITLISTQNGRVLDMRINAHNGELLELTTLP